MLKALADKYERKEFLDGDPSWFMHQVEGDTNRELLAFIASSLSYGSRRQFMPKIQFILDASHGDVTHWLLSGRYRYDIPDDGQCFYRLYSRHHMHHFLRALAEMVREYGSIKAYITPLSRQIGGGGESALTAIKSITAWFAEHGSVGVIPKDTTSSCKRLCMFLRWMVRDHSPVDLGLWADIIDKRTLIIPLDTHVMQEANRLGLIHTHTTSMATALKLTDKLRETFPDDPLKGDFALFGVGFSE